MDSEPGKAGDWAFKNLGAGLALNLSSITANQLQNLLYHEAFGKLLEGFVAAELLKQRTWSDVEFDVHHYRTSDGEEVDLIIETEDEY